MPFMAAFENNYTGVGKSVLKYRVLFLCGLLGIVIFAVYLPVRNHEFVSFDDDVYVTKNLNVQSGLSAQNIKWAFTTGYASNWHPLTWLSHQLDCTLFIGNSGAHHLVNVLFHIANTILLLIVLNRLTKHLWPSAFVAALFALHPLHVESVAWVAERKDVLSTFFWFLTILVYTRYAEKPSAFRFIVTLILFALGLMSKPMLVTLPFVLILLDYWPLDRIRNLKNVVIEKVPFFLLSVVSSIITCTVQQKGGAMAAIPFNERITNAVCSYLAYIGKMVWPINLAVLYPQPAAGIPVFKVALYTFILILITAIIIYFCKRHKYLLFGWLWYLGTLVPVIGIVQVGSQAMADRYTYVPLIGLFVIIAFAAADLFPKMPFRKIVLATLAGAILSACAIATSIQLRYWKNSTSLFERTIAVTKDNAVIYNSYASVIGPLGEYEKASKYLTEAVRIMPTFPEAHYNLGNALRNLGNFDEAVKHYNIVLKLDPGYTSAHYALGLVLADKGNYDAAIEQYKICLKPDAGQSRNITRAGPDTPKVLASIGSALAQKGQFSQAIEYYNQALKLNPYYVPANALLAFALEKTGRTDEAIAQYSIVLKLVPDNAEINTNLGNLLQNQGKNDEAIQHYKKALQTDPNFIEARDRLNALTQNK
jgi:tetratricopeptide (TPR) repeat protein